MKTITALTLLFSFSLSAFAVTVPPGTNNIQAAINSAAAGSIIDLQAGTYYVSSAITLNKTITIRGVGMSTIIQKTNGTSADVAAFVIAEGINNCTLRDFRLLGQDKGGPGILVFSNNNHLINVNVSDCGNNSAGGPGSWRSGIILDGAAFNEMTNVKSHHNSWVGISQNNSPGSNITGADCFLNHGEGLTIDLGSDNCIVRNSLFNENNVSTRGVGGIGIDDVNGADVQFCTINGTKNLSGITFQNNVGGEDGCIIKNNTINNSALNGVRIKNCTYAVTHTTVDLNSYSGNGSTNEFWECAPGPTSNRMANTADKAHFSLRVFPNPASDFITLDFGTTTEPQSIELISLTGQQVLVLQNPQAINNIDVSALSKGVYMYRATHAKGTVTGKIVLE
ncbi:MAG: T9SS type A sorting domain-containing protein [Bacteroidota bacterium]